MSITKTASKTVYPTNLIKWALLAKLFSSSFKRVKHKGKSIHKKTIKSSSSSSSSKSSSSSSKKHRLLKPHMINKTITSIIFVLILLLYMVFVSLEFTSIIKIYKKKTTNQPNRETDKLEYPNHHDYYLRFLK